MYSDTGIIDGSLRQIILKLCLYRLEMAFLEFRPPFSWDLRNFVDWPRSAQLNAAPTNDLNRGSLVESTLELLLPNINRCISGCNLILLYQNMLICHTVMRKRRRTPICQWGSTLVQTDSHSSMLKFIVWLYLPGIVVALSEKGCWYVMVLRVNDIDNNIDHRVLEHNAFLHYSLAPDNNDKGQIDSFPCFKKKNGPSQYGCCPPSEAWALSAHRAKVVTINRVVRKS